MGEWPLVIVSVRHDADSGPLAPKAKLHPSAWPRFQVAEYVEGDLTCWTYDAALDVEAKLNAVAEYWWRRPEGSGPDDLAAWPVGELPAAYRGPFRWNRVEPKQTPPDPSRIAPVVPIKKP